MTLKNQGHWKWYEWVKLNMYYHHAKFDIYHIYSVLENHNIKVIATYVHSASLTLIIAHSHFFMRVKKIHLFAQAVV